MEASGVTTGTIEGCLPRVIWLRQREYWRDHRNPRSERSNRLAVGDNWFCLGVEHLEAGRYINAATILLYPFHHKRDFHDDEINSEAK